MDDTVSQINKLISNSEGDLTKARKLLKKLQDEINKKKYEDIPGISGRFDGRKMIAEDGKSYEINPNYVAKSMLVQGDELKMIEENGKAIFKQTRKVERIKINGILSRKDGVWHALTDKGSFMILKEAAEHHGADVNDKAVVVLPANLANVAYAALEKIVRGEGISSAPAKRDDGVTDLVEGKLEKEDKGKEKEKEKRKEEKENEKPKPRVKEKIKKIAPKRPERAEEPRPEFKAKSETKPEKVVKIEKEAEAKKDFQEEEDAKTSRAGVVEEDDLR